MDASEIVQNKKRQTAFKLKIADLNRGEVIANENQSFVEIDGRHVARVNVIANIIDKFVSEGEKRYAAITIDDASSQIRVKAFADDIIKISNFEIGDTVLVIGALRFFNNEIYILPEIVRKIEPQWLLVRKLEIEKESPAKKTEKLSESSQKDGEIVGKLESSAGNVELSPKDKILDMLRKNDEGINIEEIIMSTNLSVEEINKIIAEMLENAEIYEPKPGKIRIL